MTFVQGLSGISGWLSVILFTQCLVMQAFVNYKNKSCMGYSSDFAIVGFVGYSFLLFNQLEGYVDPYSEAGKIRFMDLAFAILATTFSSISFTQTFIYPHEKRNSTTTWAIIACIAFFIGVGVFQMADHKIGSSVCLLSLVTLATIFKAASTGGKYLY